MMNYEEFQEYMKQAVLEFLPEKYQDATVQIHQIIKNNDTKRDGMTILLPEETVSPTIYLNGYYEDYQHGRASEEIAGEIADTYVEHFFEREQVLQDFDISHIGDYDAVKDRITCRLINREANSERLDNAPFTPMEDLAISYHILVSQNQDGIGSIMITNELMEQYGIDVETLHTQAMENNNRLMPPMVEDLNVIMNEMMAFDAGISNDEAEVYMQDMIPKSGPKLYCITKALKINGAIDIMDSDVQQAVAVIMGGDYYILPSSIHECLAISVDMVQDKEDLEMMVRDVNEKLVDADEVLSNNVYAYDAKEHTLELAEKYIAKHQNEKQEHSEIQGYGEVNPAFGVSEPKAEYNTSLPEQNIEAPKRGTKLH